MGKRVFEEGVLELGRSKRKGSAEKPFCQKCSNPPFYGEETGSLGSGVLGIKKPIVTLSCQYFN